jgi:putative acetyltransferase
MQQFEYPMTAIRFFNDEDLDDVLSLFHDTVHGINCRDYSPRQLSVWAPDKPDRDQWLRRLSEGITLLAEREIGLAGFGTITRDGYLDLLYVHKDLQRQHIGHLLVQALITEAGISNCRAVTTDASITARPFFRKEGFVVVRTNRRNIRGVEFTNFTMRKKLKPGPQLILHHPEED